MRPAWATTYLNIPFLERGRDRHGVDCYGLLHLMYAEQRGITLPSYAEGYTTTDDTREIAALCRGEVATRWRAVPRGEEQLFDAIIFRIKGEPIHIGVVLDKEYFVHTMKGIWSVMERWQGLVWSRRVVEVVRYGE